MHITGSCFCGELAYEAEIAAEHVMICHCTDCQKFSGSAFRMSTPGPGGSLHFTTGSPKFFEKTADSGKVRRMAFCGTCGTHICSMPPEAEMDAPGAFVSIRIATADQFDQLKPAGEIYTDSRVNWIDPIEGCMQFNKMPGQ